MVLGHSRLLWGRALGGLCVLLILLCHRDGGSQLQKCNARGNRCFSLIFHVGVLWFWFFIGATEICRNGLGEAC